MMVRAFAAIVAIAASLWLLAWLAVRPGHAESGIASIYTDHRVACKGQHYSSGALAAAHKTLPCGTMATVTNNRTGKSVVVRINDRGPYVRGRVIDLTPAAAGRIGISRRAGLAPVTVERVQ